MNYGNLSDLGQSLLLRRQSTELRTSLSQLTTELTTGLKANVSEHVGGDFGPLSGLEHSIQKLDGFAEGRTKLQLYTASLQSGLEAMQSIVGEAGTKLLAAANLEQPNNLLATASEASEVLDQMVSYLNMQVGGEFVFSGVASEESPVISSEAILTQIRTLAAGATDLPDFITQVDSWFDSSGGAFETLVYNGSAIARSGIPISEHQAIDLPIKADDQGFRDALKGLAISAVVSEGIVPATDADMRFTIETAAQGLLAAEQSLISMQRETGSTESLLENTDVKSSAERGMLELARLNIVEADPYETASALEAVQFQIESLYILTARSSQLRLSDYI